MRVLQGDRSARLSINRLNRFLGSCPVSLGKLQLVCLTFFLNRYQFIATRTCSLWFTQHERDAREDNEDSRRKDRKTYQDVGFRLTERWSGWGRPGLLGREGRWWEWRNKTERKRILKQRQNDTIGSIDSSPADLSPLLSTRWSSPTTRGSRPI